MWSCSMLLYVFMSRFVPLHVPLYGYDHFVPFSGFDFAQWITHLLVYLILVGFISIMLFIILYWYLYIYYYIYFYLFFPCVTEKPGEIPRDIYSGAHKWILLLTWLKNLVKSSDIYFGDCRCSPFLTLIICFISCISLCCYILCPHTISYTHT